MYRNLDNICRVCLNSGSRNIFEKTNTTQFPMLTSTENVSSFDRLLEKLRYVTMLKIDESENLPKCICDSCIIQLNVAYNLKKAAIQSDIKLRQYVIEYGVNVTSYTTCINTVAIVRPPGILMPSNSSGSPSITTTTTSAIVTTTEKQTTTSDAIERPSFAVMPMVIKEEPIDYEVMSDITIETNNTENYEENGANDLMRPSNTAPITIIARQKEKRNTPLVPNLMVAVNDKSLLASSSTSDVDYINAYMQTPSSSSEDSPSESSPSTQVSAHKPSTSTSAAAEETTSTRTPPITTKSTESPRSEKKSPGTKTKVPSKSRNTDQQKPKPKPRELRMLHIDLKAVPEITPTRLSRTSLGEIEPKTDFNVKTKNSSVERKPNRKRPQSIEATIVGGRSLRDRLKRLSDNKMVSKKSRVTHRKSTATPAKRVMNSSRQRTSL